VVALWNVRDRLDVPTGAFRALVKATLQDLRSAFGIHEFPTQPQKVKTIVKLKLFSILFAYY